MVYDIHANLIRSVQKSPVLCITGSGNRYLHERDCSTVLYGAPIYVVKDSVSTSNTSVIKQTSNLLPYVMKIYTEFSLANWLGMTEFANF